MEETFRIHHLPPYHLGEMARAVSEARQQGRDVIDLSQVNPVVQPDQLAVDKLVQAALLPHNHRYSSSQGIFRLREEIARYYAGRFGVALDLEAEIAVTMGTKEGLSHLLLAILTPGESVILPTPSYPIHAAGIFIAGANVIGLPLFATVDDADASEYVLTEESNSFFERLEALLQHTWPRPRVMILNFPHNPTSTIVTPGFFERLVAVAKKEQLLLVHDFAYGDVSSENYDPPSLLATAGAKDVAVEFYSCSKGLGLPGWRVGFAAGCPALVQALKKIKSYLDFGIFQPLQVGAIAAFKRASAIREDLQQNVSARRDILVAGLRELEFSVTCPKATLFVWARVPEKIRSSGSMRFARQLLEAADVAVCPGLGFDRDADEFLRFALVEDEHRIRAAVDRMRKVVG